MADKSEQPKKAGNPNWYKGMAQSPNPNGRRTDKILSDALRLAVRSDPDRARRIVERLCTIAEGHADAEVAMTAMRLIFDRLEGKAVQSIDATLTAEVISREEKLARLLELQAKALSAGSGNGAGKPN